MATSPAGDPQNNHTWLKENLGPLVGLLLLGIIAYAGLQGWGVNAAACTAPHGYASCGGRHAHRCG